MSNFNHIDYQSFNDQGFQDKSKNNSPIYRKLKIINSPNSDSNSDSNNYSDSDFNSNPNNVIDTNRIEDNILCTNNEINKNYYSTSSFKTVDLNSTMPYGYNKKENRYYDSFTNTSFNDINEFNRLNKITFDKKTQNLKLEIEDSKNILRENIQKSYERNNLLNDLEEKSNKLLDGADKFKLQSKYLKRKMYLNYICHFVALGLGVFIIILFIRILIK